MWKHGSIEAIAIIEMMVATMMKTRYTDTNEAMLRHDEVSSDTAAEAYST